MRVQTDDRRFRFRVLFSLGIVLGMLGSTHGFPNATVTASGASQVSSQTYLFERTQMIQGLPARMQFAKPPAVSAAPAQCTPGSCDDNDICTVDTCDPVMGCIFTTVNCDDGSVCTVDSCSPGGGPGLATLLIGHDISKLERQYQKNGTFVQTWGALPKATGAAVDANGVMYICNPSFGNNLIERRGPGNVSLGTITATVSGQWIEDLGNYGGGYILAGTIEGNVFRIDTTTGADTFMFSTGQNFVGVTYDGTNIWTTGGYTTTLVHRRDLAGNVLASFNTGQTNLAIGYDPDDGTLWIGHPNGQVTHRSQAGTLLGGFATAAGGQVIDGLELANLPLPAGCQHTAFDCDDLDPCTDDACDPVTGCFHTPHICDDGNPCTDDLCVPETGCVTTNNTAACEDSNLCTTGDTCSGGLCQPGTPVVCNDNNVCTTDSCDPRFGCTVVNNTNPCDDGNPCTIEDACVNGTCQPGANAACLASDQCHVAGICNPGTGFCSNPTAPNGTACNDNNPCTVGDFCIGGVCSGAIAIAAPAETQNLAVAANKSTYSWSPASDATAYDVVRGGIGALPVGSSAGGEVCFDNLTAPVLIDTSSPALHSGFWYLSRARNPCGPGPIGTQSNGTMRVTTICP